MKLFLNQTLNENRFTEYLSSQVMVNQALHELPLLVMSNVLEMWAVGGFEVLTEEDFAALLAWEPEVVLLGTGEKQRFPHPRLTAALLSQGIGVEVMDTAAACRTFNILADEGRRVLAALLK